MTNESYLLHKAKQGNPDALNEILDRYKDQAFSLALGIVHSEIDAEDIVQNAFLNVFKRLNQFRSESKFSTWLYRIVYNEALRLIKQDRTFDSIESTVDEIDVNYCTLDDSLNKLFQDDRKCIIMQALEKLTYNENTVLTLFYLEEKTIREIQQITGFSKSNIKVILHRARKNLYYVLKSMLDEEVSSIL